MTTKRGIPRKDVLVLSVLLWLLLELYSSIDNDTRPEATSEQDESLHRG
jgi:hypothetical protein